MAGREPHWEIQVLEFARSAPQSPANIYAGAHGEPDLVLPFSFALARNGDRILLVDCGYIDEGDAAVIARRVNVREWISPVRLLAECGVAPDAVTDVIVSHAHFDHIGSIAEFPKARLYIQKEEYLWWFEALALPRRFSALTVPVHPPDLVAAFAASLEGRLVLLDGDRDDILPGVHVRRGRGHTPGQQFAVLQTARGRTVVSGDCVYGARNILGNNGDGVYVPLGNGVGSAIDQLDTIDRINAEIAGDMGRLVILHDPDGWPNLRLQAEVDGFRILRLE